MIRYPVVAGMFYPSEPDPLKRQLASLLSGSEPSVSATAMVLPHAGYIYSGAVAGEVVRQVTIPEQVVLIGPNHHGRGSAVAVSAASAWQTPLGLVPVADDLRSHLLDRMPQLVADDLPHRDEHSLEVLLPFLYVRQSHLQIVPLALNHQLEHEDCKQLGQALAQALGEWGKPVLLVASSDMNHFLPARQNARLDALAIAAMTDFDPRQLYQVVEENRISMCGVLPVVTTMYAALELGGKHCRLVRYAHSGEVSGDHQRVVGYAGMIID